MTRTSTLRLWGRNIRPDPHAIAGDAPWRHACVLSSAQSHDLRVRLRAPLRPTLPGRPSHRVDRSHGHPQCIRRVLRSPWPGPAPHRVHGPAPVHRHLGQAGLVGQLRSPEQRPGLGGARRPLRELERRCRRLRERDDLRRCERSDGHCGRGAPRQWRRECRKPRHRASVRRLAYAEKLGRLRGLGPRRRPARVHGARSARLVRRRPWCAAAASA